MRISNVPEKPASLNPCRQRQSVHVTCSRLYSVWPSSWYKLDSNVIGWPDFASQNYIETQSSNAAQLAWLRLYTSNIVNAVTEIVRLTLSPTVRKEFKSRITIHRTRLSTWNGWSRTTMSQKYLTEGCLSEQMAQEWMSLLYLGQPSLHHNIR